MNGNSLMIPPILKTENFVIRAFERKDLEAVVDKLGLDTFPLFGMSQGAGVAILYCLRHPERVSQLVLYAPLVTGWKGSQNCLSFALTRSKFISISNNI